MPVWVGLGGLPVVFFTSESEVGVESDVAVAVVVTLAVVEVESRAMQMYSTSGAGLPPKNPSSSQNKGF